jgi:hypothetical protein
MFTHCAWNGGRRSCHTVWLISVRVDVGQPGAPLSPHFTREVNAMKRPSPTTSPIRSRSGSRLRQQYAVVAAIVITLGWPSTVRNRRLVTWFPPASAIHATRSPANARL